MAKPFSRINRTQLSSASVNNSTVIYGVVVILIIVGLVGAFNYFKKGNVLSSKTDKVAVVAATATQEVNRTIELSVADGKAQPVKMTVEKVELRDEVFVQGKRAKAVKGRTFLILNVKIVNDNNSSLQLQTRNFVRLSVNGNESEWLAPEIHNDPVEVQAQSVKYTRIGYSINETDKQMKLRVGKIDGDKQTIDLDQLD
ncbi:hypothetical protein A3A70_03240 [candidate division WWE3 bacterium RIFCSPLOWO2_01_FULL_42_11]|uniref:DUF4352 domain-containing protein n=1 Tax=candidate division WWE3 bacterium RIFCSPLOWO2_01_FULL_42_11 TaxID=1802627 RepID=A0A1F4VML8_UNCKA|nr:MAG: hypothetical protein A3A70_03240 [candidate division WWE3 bacterium RIFCSPLOWO2_01_FULL_42_11]